MTLGILIRVTKSFKCSITSDRLAQCVPECKVVHTLLGPVLAVESGEFGKDAHLHRFEHLIWLEDRA